MDVAISEVHALDGVVPGGLRDGIGNVDVAGGDHLSRGHGMSEARTVEQTDGRRVLALSEAHGLSTDVHATDGSADAVSSGQVVLGNGDDVHTRRGGVIEKR